MAKIYVVTHGDKMNGSNPPMSTKGYEEVAALRHLLPEKPTAVVCGTASRHLDVALALKLVPTRYTAAVGGPDSLETVKGHGKMIVLASGWTIRPELYTTLEDTRIAMFAVLHQLPDNSVICAGRPSMLMLGHDDAKSAAVYKITLEPTPEDSEVSRIEIEEVVATGESETGTV